MKKIIFVICALAIGTCVNAQDLKEKDVPALVKSGFALLYPEAKNVKWEMENGNYEAEIRQNKVETSVLFNVNGNLIQTETEIPVMELPQSVRNYSSQNLKGKSIDEACKIVDKNGVVMYEAEIGDKDYVFDSNGNFLRMDSDSGDNKDDDDK